MGEIDGDWHYLNDLGAMQTGWKLINGTIHTHQEL
ncbi:hypothetical protein [Streptococcus pseudopneumoniae]